MNEQYKVIQKQLGLDKDDRKKIIDKFKERIANKVIPEEPLKIINEELVKKQFLFLFNLCILYSPNYPLLNFLLPNLESQEIILIG